MAPDQNEIPVDQSFASVAALSPRLDLGCRNTKGSTACTGGMMTKGRNFDFDLCASKAVRAGRRLSNWVGLLSSNFAERGFPGWLKPHNIFAVWSNSMSQRRDADQRAIARSIGKSGRQAMTGCNKLLGNQLLFVTCLVSQLACFSPT